jgi:hypothetical protein
MLQEIENARQVPGEPRRRWFYSQSCELWLWFDDAGAVVGFQLSYDKLDRTRALTWKQPNQFFHTAVDTGEYHPLKYKGAPILVADGKFDAARVGELFAEECVEVPQEFAEFVQGKIGEFGSQP